MWVKVFPAAQWIAGYRRADLPGDLTAGIVVAIMLVPQGMAYALLAGLPPEVGLYASLLPVLLYALFGSSRSLAVGPVAIMSLMTGSAIGAAAAAGANPLLAAVTLAGLSGVMLLVMAASRVGFLVNFLSHPVVSGFTSAAALIIGFSQLKHLLGVDLPRTHYVHETVVALARTIDGVNLATLGISVAAIALLVLSRTPLAHLLRGWGVAPAVIGPVTKSGPLLVAVLGALAVWALGLDSAAGVAVVGTIPAGLPSLTLPSIDPDLLLELAPAALLIALVGFMESVSVAKVLAAKRRQKIEPNQELLGLGMANLGAAVTGAYPVAGGFGRSVVNHEAGANTALASIITAALIALTVLFLMPVFAFLPKAVLAAVIIVAVAALIDLHTLKLAWAYDRADALALMATFVAVLALGIELGILAGAGLAIATFLYRTSRPHIAIVGRLGRTEHFRNVERHPVTTVPSILAMRVDGSLYFANTRHLETQVLAQVADRPAVRDFVLICSAVNEIDSSALETLETLIEQLREAGVTLHLAEVKGPVTDRLARTDFLERLAPGRIFLSTHDAFVALAPADAERGVSPAPAADRADVPG